jgi:hypothetical protein
MWGNIVSCAGSPGCNGTPLQPGRWDDVTCTSVFPGTVCEFVPPKKTKKPKKSSESDED